MTTLFLLLGTLGCIGVLVGITLRRQLSRRSSSRIRPAESPDVLLAQLPSRSALEIYRPVNRLFAREEFEFLERQHHPSRGTLKRFRHTRRAVLRAYLRELRADFQRMYRICRLLSAQGPVDFAALATHEAIKFYALLLLLQLRLSVDPSFRPQLEFSQLTGMLDRLHEAAIVWARASIRQPTLAIE